jgi:hypothetical protein
VSDLEFQGCLGSCLPVDMEGVRGHNPIVGGGRSTVGAMGDGQGRQWERHIGEFRAVAIGEGSADRRSSWRVLEGVAGGGKEDDRRG